MRGKDREAVCSCGSQWFGLQTEHANHPHGAVTLDERGQVTAYAGNPVCIECDTPWTPPAERLQVVR